MSRKRKIFLALVVGAFMVAFTATHVPLSGSTGEPGIPHLDKVVHATIYFVLGTGVLVGLRMYHLRPGLAKLTWVVLALGAYAAVDESSQMLVPSRQADLLDWLANLLGIFLAVSVMLVWHAIRPAKKNDSTPESIRPAQGDPEPRNRRDVASHLIE